MMDFPDLDEPTYWTEIRCLRRGKSVPGGGLVAHILAHGSYTRPALTTASEKAFAIASGSVDGRVKRTPGKVSSTNA